MSRSLGGRSLTMRSPIEISPAVISSRPATIRSVVDFPQPDGPASTTNSLSRMWTFTSFTAWTSSYFLFRSFINTCAMSILPQWVPRSRELRALGRLALDGAGEPGDVILHEERVDQRDRHGAEQ